jgi:hypothetical protein
MVVTRQVQHLMSKAALDYLHAEFLFWSVAVAMLIAEDAAMVAMMFC